MPGTNLRMVITGVEVAAQYIHFPKDDIGLGNADAKGPRPKDGRLKLRLESQVINPVNIQ